MVVIRHNWHTESLLLMVNNMTFIDSLLLMVNNMTFIDLTNKNSFVIPLIYIQDVIKTMGLLMARVICVLMDWNFQTWNNWQNSVLYP
jgi:hypothetical protein